MSHIKNNFLKALAAIVIVGFLGLFVASLTACGSDNQEKDFATTLTEETSDESKYEGLAYLGDWYLGSIYVGEDENGEEIWETPEYLETLTIHASGLAEDTVDEDTIQGYIIPEKMETESENSYKNYSETNFKAVFLLGETDNGEETIEIELQYDPDNGTICILVDGIKNCVYYRGEIEQLTELEDGTLVDADGNEVTLEEETTE